MHKAAASPLLMVSATSRVVSVAERVLCRRLRLYRDTKYPARFLHVTGKQFAGTTKSGGDLVGNQQIPSRSHILRIRFNHSGWYMASRLRPGQSVQ